MAEVKKVATRQSYGEALAELGEKYPDLVVLDADLAAATKTEWFRKRYPDRFIDCGIAEMNMMGIAAGLAACGKIPFASSFAMFAAGRAYEIIRNSIGYPHLNVKIGATHAGVSVGEDGATHQCNEDIALMRTIPGMTVIQPSDDIETKKAVEAAIQMEGPVYMRFCRLPAPVFHTPDYRYEIGKGDLLREGSDLTLVASGLLVTQALEAAERLAKEGISARVINIHTIKPIDREMIAAAAEETHRIFTVEEHNIIGGLGAAVAEVVCETCPVPVTRIGMNDCYGQSGPAAELLTYYGLDADGICRRVKETLGK